jgi:myo-inositol-1(or 4)-monophosphatase
VGAPRSFASAFLVTGFYYQTGAALEREVARFTRVAQECPSVRRDGSAALDLALVAAGVYDAFWENGLQPWDVAAGVLLVTEAGGIVRNYGALGYDMYAEGLVAGTPTAVSAISAHL